MDEGVQAEAGSAPALHIGARTAAPDDLKQAVAQVARRLPGSSRVFGPPRRVATWRDYPTLEGAKWTEVVASARAPRPAPAYADFDWDAYLSTLDDLHTPLPPAGVMELRDARIVGDMGWVVDRNDAFLAHHSWYGPVPGICPILRRFNLQPRRRLEGVTLLLGSDWAAINYSHMLHDALARAHLFEAAGGRWDAVDRVIAPTLDTPGARALLALLGAPADKIVSLSEVGLWECERLIAPSFPGQRRDVAPWAVRFWRERKGPPPRRPGRRVYVTRAGFTRSVVNEEEVRAVLARYGFETLAPTVEDTSDLFREAEFVVGPHGAALCNTVFMPPGGRLLEFTPSRYPYPYFYTLSVGAGFTWGAVLARSADGPANHAAIHVPPASLERALRAMGA